MPRARSRRDAAPSISSDDAVGRPGDRRGGPGANCLMLEGTFSEAEKLAREAIRVARACDPPARRLGAARDDHARRVARLAGRP